MASPRFSRFGITTVIALVILIGTGGLYAFTQKEQQRDLVRWQDQLNLIADSRARDVNGWVQTQFRELTALADNAALQIYFVTLQAQQAAAEDAEDAEAAPRPAQGDYLHNLLTMTAERLGFQASGPSLEQQVRANVRKLATGGLALLDRDGKLVMATATMPPLEGTLAQQVSSAPRGKSALIDIAQAQDGSQQIGFIIPIFSVQGDRSPASQIGSLVGIKPVDAKFFALLKPEPSPIASLEVALVRREGDSMRYLSPLMDGATPMTQREQNNAAQSAAAYAAANPGGFAQRLDYRAKDVLITGREIPGTSWSLIAKVDSQQALAESVTWQRTIAAVFGLMMLAVITTLIAVWRNANARRAEALSEQAQELAEESYARAQLLSLVTDHQPEPLYIVDEAMQVWFTNYAAALSMQTSADDVRGKPLTNIAGSAMVKTLQPHCATALATGTPGMAMVERMDGTSLRTICTRFVPLDHIPVEGMEDDTRGVLITEQDVTDAINEREKRLHTLNQVIATLVSLVDKRDPHAAQHSAYVAMVAASTAREMGLDAQTIETTETAAQLMNLGKIDVPTEMLQRKGKLNELERDAIRNSVTNSAKLLQGIAFEGPVSETLRQTSEHVDGNGPLKMKGDAILISARIVAAANALVGMVSPRSYRASMSVDDATKVLLGDINTRFDRKVIVALINYLDNRGGREKLKPLQANGSSKTSA